MSSYFYRVLHMPSDNCINNYFSRCIVQSFSLVKNSNYVIPVGRFFNNVQEVLKIHFKLKASFLKLKIIYLLYNTKIPMILTPYVVAWSFNLLEYKSTLFTWRKLTNEFQPFKVFVEEQFDVGVEDVVSLLLCSSRFVRVSHVDHVVIF